MYTVSTTTTDVFTFVMGGYVVAVCLGIVIASTIMLVWLIIKGRRGGAYADTAM